MSDKHETGISQRPQPLNEIPFTGFEELSLNGLGVLAYLRNRPHQATKLIDLEEKFFDQRSSLKEGLEELETHGFIITTINLEIQEGDGN